MNKSEHLLTIVAEECAEVQKEISKALRFGLDDKLTLDPDGPRGTEGPTNRQKIAEEFLDLLGAYQEAVSEGILPDLMLYSLPLGVVSRMRKKSSRIRSYMRYALRVGTLSCICFVAVFSQGCYYGSHPDLAAAVRDAMVQSARYGYEASQKGIPWETVESEIKASAP